MHQKQRPFNGKWFGIVRDGRSYRLFPRLDQVMNASTALFPESVHDGFQYGTDGAERIVGGAFFIQLKVVSSPTPYIGVGIWAVPPEVKPGFLRSARPYRQRCAGYSRYVGAVEIP